MSFREDCDNCTEETICRKHFITAVAALAMKHGGTMKMEVEDGRES